MPLSAFYCRYYYYLSVMCAGERLCVCVRIVYRQCTVYTLYTLCTHGCQVRQHVNVNVCVCVCHLVLEHLSYCYCCYCKLTYGTCKGFNELLISSFFIHHFSYLFFLVYILNDSDDESFLSRAAIILSFIVYFIFILSLPLSLSHLLVEIFFPLMFSSVYIFLL